MRGRLGAISDMRAIVGTKTTWEPMTVEWERSKKFRVPGGLATKWPSPFRSPQLRDSRPQTFLWELLYGKFGWPIRADCN